MLEAFPPNIYEILVFVLCPKKLLMEVNRWVTFVRQMSEEKCYYDSNTLLGRKEGGHYKKVEGVMGRSHLSGGLKGWTSTVQAGLCSPLSQHCLSFSNCWHLKYVQLVPVFAQHTCLTSSVQRTPMKNSLNKVSFFLYGLCCMWQKATSSCG